VKFVGAIGLVVALFVVAYAPIFILVSALHLSKETTIPAVIVGTSIIALLAMGVIGWWLNLRLADFGLRWPAFRFLALALLVSIPVGAVAAVGATHLHETGPLRGLVLTPALTWLYFGFAAPLQEELIFRGLLQTALADRLRTITGRQSSMPAVAIVALLFALIHLEVGPFTAACALALGLIAGEFRRRSGSIAPSVLCHAIFNIAGIIAA
jgi:membrane protease YdiL (CAAX protease family)